MRALRYDRFGPPDVLHVDDVPDAAPAVGEVLVRVRAAGLNPLDWKIRAGHLRLVPLLARPPRGIGCDFAGDVVGVGGGAHARHVGERVFGSLPPFPRQGSCAELLTIGADRIAVMPAILDYREAAALPVAGGTAVQALDDHAHLAAGQRILISGAAGGVGHFAVQLARHRGAHVTAVCSAGNVDFVRAQGADDVVDYGREDVTTRNATFDVILDAAGAWTYFGCRRLLAPEGLYLGTSGSTAAAVSTVVGGSLARLSSRQRAVSLALRAGARAWERLAVLAADGVLRPQVAPTIGFDGVAQAQRAMETGHGRGKIVVVPEFAA
jgi:NADPH:quinone reductase-like Zn-dependent oxidoreductase